MFSRILWLLLFCVSVGLFWTYSSGYGEVGTAKFRDCVQARDYVCVVKVLNEHPPASIPYGYEWQTGSTLAYLGETDLAIEVMEKVPDIHLKRAIASDIVRYLAFTEQHDQLNSAIKLDSFRQLDKSITKILEPELTVSDFHLRLNSHQKKVISLARSQNEGGLKAQILKQLANPKQKHGAGNRNYQLYNYYLKSISWLEELSKFEDSQVANIFTKSILKAADPLGERSCISGLYGLAAYLHSRIESTKLAREYLNAGETYLPELTDELSDDGECVQGHYAFIGGLRATIGDKLGLRRFIDDIGTSFATGQLDRNTSGFVSFFSTAFRLHGAVCHTDSKFRKFVLDYIIESRRRSGHAGIFPVINAMEIALLFGDLEHVMNYAHLALSFADELQEENVQNRIIEGIKSKIIGREFSSGWRIYHMDTSCTEKV